MGYLCDFLFKIYSENKISLLLPSICKMNSCDERELTILKLISNMHVDLLPANFCGALPGNCIADVLFHRMLILSVAFAWNNSMSMLKL
jgi:hypothetical protein